MAAAVPGRASPAPATTTRRVVPIKRADGEPLTRADLQFDFLNAVFSDSNAVFTNPYAPPPKQDEGGGEGEGDGENSAKITFAELYTNAIVHSPKATKVLKETMRESPAFAVDFSMLALLVNVGRVNTTMSCECVCDLGRVFNGGHKIDKNFIKSFRRRKPAYALIIRFRLYHGLMATCKMLLELSTSSSTVFYKRT